MNSQNIINNLFVFNQFFAEDLPANRLYSSNTVLFLGKPADNDHYTSQ